MYRRATYNYEKPTRKHAGTKSKVSVSCLGMKLKNGIFYDGIYISHILFINAFF